MPACQFQRMPLGQIAYNWPHLAFNLPPTPIATISRINLFKVRAKNQVQSGSNITSAPSPRLRSQAEVVVVCHVEKIAHLTISKLSNRLTLDHE